MEEKVPTSMRRIGITTSKMFAEKIKNFRRTRAMSYFDLAIFIGVTTLTVYNWEKKGRMPTNKLIIQKLIEEGVIEALGN